MRSPGETFAAWFCCLAFLALFVWFVVLPHVLYSGPVLKDTPFVREMAGIHGICTKLVHYAEEHHALPSAAAGKTVESLVAAGILSGPDGRYIRDHHIEFHGFDPTAMSADVVIFETVFTNTEAPRKIIGYGDGHVAAKNLEMAK